MTEATLRKLSVMCTINAISLTTIVPFLELLMQWRDQYGDRGPSFTLNMLDFPSFQHLNILPLHIRMNCADQLRGFEQTYSKQLSSMELEHVRRLVPVVEATVDLPELAKLQADFSKFYQQYDRRRGKDFLGLFPNLKELYERP
jgi:hypothetical protein